MALTISIDSLSATSPKTTCLPSSQLVTTVVIKNWEPLLRGTISKRKGTVAMLNDLRVGTRVSHREETRLVVLQLEVFVGELLTID
jgi:hypothetical protein